MVGGVVLTRTAAMPCTRFRLNDFDCFLFDLFHCFDGGIAVLPMHDEGVIHTREGNKGNILWLWCISLSIVSRTWYLSRIGVYCALLFPLYFLISDVIFPSILSFGPSILELSLLLLLRKMSHLLSHRTHTHTHAHTVSLPRFFAVNLFSIIFYLPLFGYFSHDFCLPVAIRYRWMRRCARSFWIVRCVCVCVRTEQQTNVFSFIDDGIE